MNLPFILDVAFGLIFSYLILSLLASEIQELLATVFQWRAEHLKKSIEILLAGDVRTSEDARVIQLANNIYSHPLVKNINQEAKGFFVTLPRRLTWGVGSAYRSVTTARPGGDKDETVFGENKRSGPSYIPANIFASTYMETLQLPTLVQTLTESRLDKFKIARLDEIEQVLVNLKDQINDDESFAPFLNTMFQQFHETRADFEQILWNFQNKKANLNISVNRMGESLDRYIEIFQTDMPKNDLCEKALKRIQFIRKDIFTDVEQTISLGGLRPNVNEVVESLKKDSAVYQEIQDSIKDKDSETNRGIKNAIDTLPESVVENISVLGKRAQARVRIAKEGIHALQEEIEHTFDSSMDRASGVYKRNAKGVAFMLGLGIAITANADAFHMMSRLSKDSALRDTITNNIGEIYLRNPNNQAIGDANSQGNQDENATILEKIRQEADGALDNVSLPIGWSNANLNQQIAWTPKTRQSFPFWKILTMIPGWIFSGIAISMGAPFWFDLLGKFVNVRNTGRRPVSDFRSQVNNDENGGG